LVPQPPPPNAPPPNPNQDRTVVIIINKDHSMMLNTEPMDVNRLGARLEEVFKTRAERVVFVKADPDLEFQPVATAIDIAKGAGIDKIGLMTPKVEEGK
jgi:biopolymer transport protein TolR